MGRSRQKKRSAIPRLLRSTLAGVLFFANLISAAPYQQGSNAPIPVPVPPLQPPPVATPPNQPAPFGFRPIQDSASSEGRPAAQLAPARLDSGDTPLPINLATALRLAGARPLLIAATEASVQVAAEQLAKAKVLWLPSIYTGAGYYRHDGASQGQSGSFQDNSREQFMAGSGAVVKFSTADAIYAPLAARQTLRSRQIDVQTARNDVLLTVAQSYFDVQQARGLLASAQDVIEKSHALSEKVSVVEPSAVRATDLHRALAQLAEFEEAVAIARERWQTTSVDLTQVLRLNPSAVVVPAEPPHLRVTLISPQESVDALIPIGLVNRPELASQQALVQAALARIKQERMRPLIPSLLIQGGASPVAPGGYLMGGVFASGVNSQGNPTESRDDVSVQLLWGLDNMGLANRAMVRERRAEQQQLVIEFSRIQDIVAAEIGRAHAQLESSLHRVTIAERGLNDAQLAYAGSMEELGKTTRVSDIVVTQVVRRAFEVVDALRSLSRAYESYFTSVADYNRAQFRLFRALGYPAGTVPNEALQGGVQPIDTSRPQMPADYVPQSGSKHH